MHDPVEALVFALQKYPERVEMVPLADLVEESARAKPNRMAYVKINVPDELVKALRGDPEKSRSQYFVVSIPKDVQERSESLIILPGEV